MYGWVEMSVSVYIDIMWASLRNVEWIAGLMRKGQRINHFPKMSACCEKGMTARLLNAQRMLFPEAYTFYPRSWEIRSEQDLRRFEADFKANTKAGKTYIVKPV